MKKVMLTLLLTAMFSMLFTGFINNSASAATGNEVKLLHANWFSYATSSTSCCYAKMIGSIEVENIAYHKQVNVVYRYKTDTAAGNMTWKKFAATYAAPTEGNYEAWEFEMPVNYVYMRSYYGQIEFYIEYGVADNLYVDDNGGNYYLIGHSGPPSIIMNKPAVKMAASVWTGSELTRSGDKNWGPGFGTNGNFAGGVYVKNLSPDKEVKIIYTTDNWATVKQAWASYNSTEYNTSSSGNLELWKFDVPVDPSVNKVEMAVVYIVNGVQYWDTNYNNRNYIIER